VWAALVPMSVSTNVSGAEALKDVAVWAFHGADDLAVSKGESVIKTIIDAGNTRAKFSALKGEGKNVLPYVIIRDDMHKWLFEQRRGAAK
jgi:predicted peptidase